ncbi:Phosphate regulon transcriptional regulatory protein PhoB [Bacteroides pyogenes]|uniref:DNA-binding response regulator n=2 Tax=Bacteroides pyogenes TaxID=310300 RepID=W4PDU2_9BACE|nr:response regulator transcription factor [Bacteroides pyogenes]GAE14156.1 DNA-binding response regulator [Bacteroides pyogenes JCM 6292]MBR8704302.1 Phosphate regulon transcriptional regulatory protein PhoB [Bacteroides pyogenes]MBR8719115.1 Phosphate regulon transcriptional regulatory protein PhoB [Bacteroides pyogenes]MBR8788228.1 Phosphate regulon transcriptional regulatory protein PhoB [Bacteroides pyogenes]MBR8793744.1 Phosphate regulon transcriptional regulatory protein PhoB [Bacteroid
MKILIIEDEASLLEVMTSFLEKEQYVVESANTYQGALSKVADYDYDCILLDIMLPDGDGIDLLKELQKIKKNQNVIIISAKDSVEDKVAGLEIGADDYLSKPFHLAELNARIRSVFRRKDLQGDTLVRLENVTVNPTTHEAYVDGNRLELNRKEYNILLYFMTRPNHLIDKAVLAEAVWGDHIDQADNFDFIYTQVKNLRKKMNEAGAGIEIKAVYGLGYKLALR